MATPSATGRPSSSAAAPAPVPPPSKARAPPPLAAPPLKAPPPNAVLIKTSKTPPLLSPAGAAGGASRGPSSESSAPPTPAAVPAHCWYANAFTQSTNTPMSEFHRRMRGKVFFSSRAVPVAASELLLLPGEVPPQLTLCEVGKDLLYGVAYLYNTPLSVEHQWRGRVTHLQRVRSAQAPMPDLVRRRAEAVAALQREKHSSTKGNGNGEKSDRSVPPTPAASASAAHSSGTGSTPVDYSRTMCFERGEASVYDRPGDDLLLGFKVYVDDELVEDHYPIVNALPQCTATLSVKEAAQHWNCVPFVLMGYLNQPMLDPIGVYRSLSLNVVEHLLRVKLPAATAAAPEKKAVVPPTLPEAKAAPAAKKRVVSRDLQLRIEVVYGCRAEAYYCTDFISRGACVLRMTESSKAALKKYEERLRALVKLRLSSPQLIPRTAVGTTRSSSSSPASPPPLPLQQRNCNNCGHPLQYCCTVCGADVCGMPTCVANAVVGYPRGCTKHVLNVPPPK